MSIWTDLEAPTIIRRQVEIRRSVTNGYAYIICWVKPEFAKCGNVVMVKGKPFIISEVFGHRKFHT